MDILRFITAGSVDDGKSTLIGRLLLDSKNILKDQLQAIERASKTTNDIDLALLTDGLKAEREQGITIDVAYKYFATDKRKFIIADAPGHIQYTRNMITGASNTSLIIILVDARNGISEQTRRHSIIASLLNIPNVVVAINKMDLVNYSEKVFNDIVEEYRLVAEKLSLQNVAFIPVSALKGDNIVTQSNRISWYQGPTLLSYLETVSLTSAHNLDTARFPVQYIIRPQSEELHDYRGYAGRIASGIYKVGDEVAVYPLGLLTKIKAIEANGKNVSEAFAPQSVVLHLEDDLDVSRGDLIIKADQLPHQSAKPEALLCWMDSKPLNAANRYLLQLYGEYVPVVVEDIQYKVDVNTLEKTATTVAKLNDIVKVNLKAARELPYDKYNDLKETGRFILVDETSNLTVAAGLFQ